MIIRSSPPWSCCSACAPDCQFSPATSAKRKQIIPPGSSCLLTLPPRVSCEAFWGCGEESSRRILPQSCAGTRYFKGEPRRVPWRHNSFLFALFKISLLRFNLDTITRIHFKCKLCWVLVFVQFYNHHHSSVLEHFHHHKTSPYVHLQSVSFPRPGPRQPLIFLSYSFALSRISI